LHGISFVSLQDIVRKKSFFSKQAVLYFVDCFVDNQHKRTMTLSFQERGNHLFSPSVSFFHGKKQAETREEEVKGSDFLSKGYL